MCGIAGFTGQPNERLLEDMTNVLSYRGPDGFGYFADSNINLGHRRLSIIDINGGAQPMVDSSDQVAIVFNGEIYNYQELKSTLQNYQFKTNSDTEVILNLYLEKGEDFLQYLNGMFSLALWDKRENKLILARDRMGQKPLYYFFQDDNLFFASEPKSLLKAMQNRELDLDSVRLFFQFQYLPKDKSIYKGLKKVLPGSYLVWQNGEHQLKKYWNLNFDNSGKSDEVENLLKASVKRRLISDVPLGVFLSGGLDSSTITYFAKENSNAEVKTFSIGFSDKSFDESAYAQEVANHLGTRHFHKNFSDQDLISLLPKIFEKLDEPLADASVLPTYLLSEFARESVTVALGGDGSDELFAGYPTFQAHKLADLYQRLPRVLKVLIKKIVYSLPVSFDNFSLDFKLKSFLRGADKQGYQRDLAWMSAFDREEQQRLFTKDFLSKSNLKDIIDMEQQKQDSQVLHFWQRGYLVEDVLSKVDRASMYNSLEVRAPFLDYKLVEEINNLPHSYKIEGFKTKALLKNIMSGKLPSNIINRKKKGFGLPLAKWFRGELKELVQSSLSKEELDKIGIFNQDYVDSLVKDHLDKKCDNRIKIWTLLTFVYWHKNWIQ